MTFNEAKLLTKLGVKVKLSHWTSVKYAIAFDNDKYVRYELNDGSKHKAQIPSQWDKRTDWEIYHEV